MMSDLTYTPSPLDGQIDDEVRLLHQAFGGKTEDTAEWLGAIERANFRRVVRAGEVVGCVIKLPMGIFFGGRSVKQIGVHAVGVGPEARGGGVARFLMIELIRELHTEGVPLSTLYSAMHPLYRSAGYETAGFNFSISVPTGMIESPDRGKGWRVFDKEKDQPGVEACYLAMARDRDGYIDRNNYLWTRIRTPRTKPAEGFVAEDESGAVEAYCFYRLNCDDWPDPEPTGSGGGLPMKITDMGYNSPRGMDRLLGFLRGFSSVVGEAKWAGQPSGAMLLRLPDRRFSVRVGDPWMLRVVDLPKALEARGYPAGVRTELHLRIDDPVIESNNKPIVLRVEDGRGTVTPGGDGRLQVNVMDFAPVYTGMVSAREQRAGGRLEGDEGSLAICDSLFGSPNIPSMADDF